jgi:ppGpp synthetase/RelA/SpoT-type nucleotidyltranferase
MEWVVCQNSKGQINRAGDALINLNFFDPRRDDALEVINNWRSCHQYPLHVITASLQDRARKVNKKALVARRIKRLQSISLKLRQNPTMKLSQMQDIGGCRAVLKNPAEVDQLVAVYYEAMVNHPSRTDRSYVFATDDYMANPKDDGYRGVHLIMKYQSDTESKKAYNGQRIEIQIRSKLQHAWATAVETCQAFTGQALKSKIKTASDEWIRFFAVMSSAIAAREKRPLVPGTPTDKDARKAELKALEHEHQIIAKLRGWTTAMSHERVDDHQCAAFLLELDTQKRVLKLQTFKQKEMVLAYSKYLSREKETEADAHIQVVLVSADSVANLRRAYPNFYVDTNDFIAALTEEIY